MPQLEMIDICWLSLLWLDAVFPVFILYTVRSVLQLIQPNHRLCSPDFVWWCLIPVFGHFVLFSITTKIATSLHRQFHEIEHHLPVDQYGASMGKYWALSGIFFNSSVLMFLVIYQNYRFLDLLKFENSVMLIPAMAVRGMNSFLYWMTMIKNRRRLMNYLNAEMSDEELNYQDEDGGDS